MDIDTSLPALRPPATTALDGMDRAQARVAEATERVAAGDLDPAVILDVVEGERDFAASAKVLQAADENTRRLLDVIA